MLNREKVKEIKEKRLQWPEIDKAVSAFHHWKGHTVLVASRSSGDDNSRERYKAFEDALDKVDEKDLRAAYEATANDVYIALVGLKKARVMEQRRDDWREPERER